jgi:hypothetical protein
MRELSDLSLQHQLDAFNDLKARRPALTFFDWCRSKGFRREDFCELLRMRAEALTNQKAG